MITKEQVKFYKKAHAPTFNQYVQAQGTYIYQNQLYRVDNTQGLVFCLFSIKHKPVTTYTGNPAGYDSFYQSVIVPQQFELFLESKGYVKKTTFGVWNHPKLPKLDPSGNPYKGVRVIQAEPGKYLNSGKYQKFLLAMKLTDFNLVKNKKVVVVQNRKKETTESHRRQKRVSEKR